jgi:hypothetical protein
MAIALSAVKGGTMIHRNRFGLGVLACALVFVFRSQVASAQQPTATLPQPTVPELFTIEGEFVRVAYNNEGFATLGYRTVQESVGQNCVLLDVGITLRKGVKDFTLKRANLSLKTPDGKTVPLATQAEFAQTESCQSLILRDNMIHDSINYFPPDTSYPCAIKFFSQPGAVSLAYDQVDLSWDRACLGRVFFRLPGGIVPGQYWFNIQFASSVVQAPFRVMTKDEEKLFRKKWEDLKKAQEEALKQ